MSSSSLNEEKFAFVHLQKIQIDKPRTETESKTGILAVSVPTNLEPRDDVVLLVQVAVGNDLYSSRHTEAQICSNLKLDRSSLPAHTVADGTKGGSSSRLPEVDYLVGLLESTVQTDATSARQITFEFTNGGNDELRITIKERLKTGIVRFLWSTHVSSDEGGSLLDLTLRLLHHQEDVAEQLASGKTQYNLLEKDRDGWKDTAIALDGKWEEEKTMLFQNFCDLYAAKQEHEKSKVAGLQLEIAKLRDDAAAAAAAAAALLPCRHE